MRQYPQNLILFAMARKKPSDRCNLAPAALTTPGKVMLLGMLLLPTPWPSQLCHPYLPPCLIPRAKYCSRLCTGSTTSEAGRYPLCMLAGEQLGTCQLSLSMQGPTGFGDR